MTQFVEFQQKISLIPSEIFLNAPCLQYKADQFRAGSQSYLGHSARRNSAIAYYVEPLDNWIQLRTATHFSSQDAWHFWEIKWNLYYTGTVVLHHVLHC